MFLALLAIALMPSSSPDQFNGTWRGKAQCDRSDGDIAIILKISGGPRYTVEYRVPKFSIRGTATRRAVADFDPNTNELPHPVRNGLSLRWPHIGYFSELVSEPTGLNGGAGRFEFGPKFRHFCNFGEMQRVG